MAEEDNFDIDIYGDGGEDYQEEGQVHDQGQHAGGADDANMQEAPAQPDQSEQDDSSHVPDTSLPKPPIANDQSSGAKRKDGPDDRPVEPGATNALFVGELSWWTTDDDVRSWTKDANCEDELKELTFNEQKVNGKSKGQAFLLFDSPQAATAVKYKIDALGDSGKYRTKINVAFTNPLQNPFKTLPKDGPMRNQNRNTSGNFNSNTHQSGFNPNYRGRGRGNFNAGGSGGGGGFNNRGGYQQSGAMSGGFQGNPMSGGFSGGMNGGMNTFTGGGGGGGGGYGGGRGMMGGRGGRGGMMGGRGGMQPNMMGGGMSMGGGMMPGMGMPMMNPMQGGGFQGGYNPGFGYPQGNPGPDPGWSGPNKRQRQE